VLIQGCASVDPTVKIGLVGPFEGKNREVGYDVIYSARLAIREINENGGIGPYRLALVALDDGGDAEMATETAASLVIDPGVMAVVGHWLPGTTAAGKAVYDAESLPFVSAGQEPVNEVEPASLPAEFRRAYADITPFDEEAGPFAGPAYDAVNLVLAAMKLDVQDDGQIDRQSLQRILGDFTYEGLTGPVYAP
jgi:ABC-type branched-subunit amino acid transport system substrate-binding protein